MEDWFSLVVRSSGPQRFDVLRKQRHKNQANSFFLSIYVSLKTFQVTFLVSSLQLQALISPFPALSRWQSVDRREKTGPS